MVASAFHFRRDVADGGVVKGVNFVGLRDAGDPVGHGLCVRTPPVATKLVFSTSPRASGPHTLVGAACARPLKP